jgi:hypothetical protein
MAEIQSLENEIITLKEEINKLKKEKEILKESIAKMQDDQGLKICEYYNSCKNISQTADKFYFSTNEDCYWALVEYFGCSDPLQRAHDYEELHRKMFGSDEDEDIDKEEEDEEQYSETVEGILEHIENN